MTCTEIKSFQPIGVITEMEKSKRRITASEKTAMPTVLTIGHSTHPWKVFLALLRAHRVERVIDVRSIPRSRHNPQFNQDDPAHKAAVREDQLCALAKARRPAPRETRFSEHGVA